MSSSTRSVKLLLLLLLLPLNGWGAWTFSEICNNGQSKTANQASISVTECTSNAGEVIVVVIAVDNNQTTDGDEAAVSFSTETNGNTYSKACEFTNGQGGAQSGATVSVWYSLLTNATTSGNTATFNLTNSASRDASSYRSMEFTIAASSTISVAGTCQTLANDNADAGSQTISGLSSSEYLFFRGIASETDTGAISSTTASYTSNAGATCTAGGGEATNMCATMEYRILTGTGDTSDPTMADTTADRASVYVALLETAGGGGGGTTHPGWYGPSGWF